MLNNILGYAFTNSQMHATNLAQSWNIK